MATSKANYLWNLIITSDQVFTEYEKIQYPVAMSYTQSPRVITFTFDDTDYSVTEQTLNDAVINDNTITLDCNNKRTIKITLAVFQQVEVWNTMSPRKLV